MRERIESTSRMRDVVSSEISWAMSEGMEAVLGCGAVVNASEKESRRGEDDEAEDDEAVACECDPRG